MIANIFSMPGGWEEPLIKSLTARRIKGLSLVVMTDLMDRLLSYGEPNALSGIRTVKDMAREGQIKLLDSPSLWVLVSPMISELDRDLEDLAFRPLQNLSLLRESYIYAHETLKDLGHRSIVIHATVPTGIAADRVMEALNEQ